MIVVEKIMMQRRDPNGLQKEYHKSDRIATAMCDAAGFDAEYAGMAVHRAHGGRGGPAARTVVCPRPGLSFQMHTPDWFRQFVNPFPTPHGSAASCISCGIFWSMCRRKRRNPSDDPYKTVDEVDIRSVESNCTK